MDPHFKNPFVDQWNVGVQQQLGSDTMIEVNYVGSRGMRTPFRTTFGRRDDAGRRRSEPPQDIPLHRRIAGIPAIGVETGTTRYR